MPLRLIEIVLPKMERNDIQGLFDEETVVGHWQAQATDNGLLVKMLLSAEHTEAILDRLEEKFSYVDGFRVVLLPVEATLPRLKETDEAPALSETAQPEAKKENDADRISREELYTDISDSIKLSKVYLAMVVLSSIVAAVGLLRDNVAIVIGAMVIAPLLGPNVALALATTLGDFDLGRKALKANSVGLATALGLSVVVGFIVVVNPTSSEISSRTTVGLSDIVLALAAGSAGVLAFSGGVSTALIGVMVAVALLPPLVTFGLLLGSGNQAEAFGAFLLVVTNIICVNLAGVSTFLLQGVRPRQWWEATKAERATRIAILLWTMLLLVLIAVIILSQQTAVFSLSKFFNQL